jgi:hypothetical protein
MKLNRWLNALKTIVFPFGPCIWMAARYRGFLIDSLNQCENQIYHETRIMKEAIDAGIRIVNPFEVFAGIDAIPVLLPACRWTSLHDRIEYPLLAAIVAHLKPKTVFEFGTYTGEASLVFAKSSPSAQIFTVNIPGSQKPKFQLAKDQEPELLTDAEIGKAFHRCNEASRIKQILCDSADLDIEPFRNSVDFVWVDAGHSYDCVKSDTNKAFEMVRPGGYIFWHDFDSYNPGITSCLIEEALKGRKLFWIDRTSIIYWNYAARPPSNHL